jgi:hypothetical protein
LRGLALNANSTVIAALSATSTRPFGYTFIQVDAIVDLAGASLQLAPTTTIIPGMSFNLIVSPVKVHRMFAQGTTFMYKGATYDISYGSTVVLTRRS